MIKENSQGIACFLFFLLLLSVKSGYGLAALASLFLAFIYFRDVKFWFLSKKELFFVFSGLIFSIFWGVDFSGDFLINDFLYKYVFAVLIFVSAIFVRVKKVFYVWGVFLGAVLAFLIAFFQYQEVGRASGFTNAIRFGDLALWMACACLIFFVFSENSNIKKIILLIGSFAGFFAALLSLSRGGWLFVFLLPFLFLIFADSWKKSVGVLLVGLLLGCFSIFIGLKIPFVEKRVLAASNEVVAYIDKKPGSATTSVGARLEQWSLAWRMGMEKPWLGWGERGYLNGREEYVERGLADPSVVNFAHPHNDFLNVFVKKGVFGVFGLILIYIAPLILFWPRRLNFKIPDEQWVRDYKAVCLIGISIPMSYFTFGLTEYFFHLNIGHIFYIFSIIYTYSLLKNLEIMKNV